MSLFSLPLFYPVGTQTHHKVKLNVGFDHICNESVLKAHFDIMVHVSMFKCGLRIAAVCLCALPYLLLSSILAQHNTHCSYMCVCVCVCVCL